MHPVSRDEGQHGSLNKSASKQGAKQSWYRPLHVTMFAVCDRGGAQGYRAADEVGVYKLLPWAVPVGRRRRVWVPLVREDGSRVMSADGKATELLLELSRRFAFSRAAALGLVS